MRSSANSQTPRDCVFTTEYAVRTAMEAVYTLLNIDRGVLEVFASAYDVRIMLNATAKLMDDKKPIDMKVPFSAILVEKGTLHVVSGTVIKQLLTEHKII